MRLKRVKCIFLSIIILIVIYMTYNYSILIKNNDSRKFVMNFWDISQHSKMFEKYITNDKRPGTNELFAKHLFSVQLSDRIGAFRTIPDTRDTKCYERNYKLPYNSKVSIIISYHNEARSALLRTIVTILERTPFQYLEEIILVDDFSDNESDGLQLTFLPYVKLFRNSQREGLVRSRNKGAELSIGDYILFLDSHCEVNVGWLEPLLARLSLNPGVAVSPIIDSIDSRTFRYKGSVANLKGGFDWNLHFNWIPMSDEERDIRSTDPSQPFASPTTAGGIFMISRQWFFQLDGFDRELEIWGGESLEISIKIWLCGGQIEITPCSRIGHVFRKKHPYEFPLGSYQTYLRNSKRVAESWMDEYKHFFYSSKPEAFEVPVSANNISDSLKQDLQCRKFSWYLQNVFSELKFPNEEYVAFGQIKCDTKCLTIITIDKIPKVLLRDCHETRSIQWSLHAITGQLSTNSGACLNVKEKQVVLDYCNNKTNQRWNRNGAKIIHDETGLCLENILKENVEVTQCRRGAPSQLFSFSVELQRL